MQRKSGQKSMPPATITKTKWKALAKHSFMPFTILSKRSKITQQHPELFRDYIPRFAGYDLRGCSCPPSEASKLLEESLSDVLVLEPQWQLVPACKLHRLLCPPSLHPAPPLPACTKSKSDKSSSAARRLKQQMNTNGRKGLLNVGQASSLSTGNRPCVNRQAGSPSYFALPLSRTE